MPALSDQDLFIVGIFIATTLLTLAIALPLTGGEARRRRRMRARIHEMTAVVPETEQVSLVRRSYLQRLSPFERWLESSPALRPLVLLIERAGFEELPAYRLVLLSLAAAVVAAIAALVLVEPAPLPAAAGAALGAAAPPLWLVRKQRERLKVFEEQLPEALSMLARTLRAGLPLVQALQVGSEELDGPVAKEFGIIFSELNFGGELRTALADFYERVPSVSVSALSAAIMIQRETGGNLAEVVSRLERLIRERFRFQRELRTMTASNRTSAWIVGAMPFALAGVLELSQPGYMGALFDEPGGRKLLYVALGLQALGVFTVVRLTKMDV